MSANRFTLMLALFFTTVVNLPLNTKLYQLIIEDPNLSWGFVLSMPFFFTAVFFLVFWFFTFPLVIKPLSITLVMISAVVSYSMYSYGIIFDSSMIQNLFETNYGEASSYLNLSLITWVTLMGLLPAVVIHRTRVEHKPVFRELFHKAGGIILALIVIGLVALGFSADYAAFGRTNSSLKRLIIPTQYLSSTYHYLDRNVFSTPPVYQTLGRDAELLASDNGKPELMVLILGETARAQNFQWNDYPRETNKFTQNEDLITFQNVSSCGTATAVSVPCMFSRMSKSDFESRKAQYQDNLVDLFVHAGINVLWLENDGGCKGVCQNVETWKYGPATDSQYCEGEFCDDRILLEAMDDAITQVSGKDALIVLHLNGSHGPTYFERYGEEFRNFVPDCQRSDIQNCSSEELVNTYDNTLLHTDYVIAQAISRLKELSSDWDPRLVYISDHGESLGEKGFYLHGMPYAIAPDEQTRIPWMLWLSESVKEQQQIKPECVSEAAKEGQFSHDNFFDSILGLMTIRTDLYLPELDVLAGCRAG